MRLARSIRPLTLINPISFTHSAIHQFASSLLLTLVLLVAVFAPAYGRALPTSEQQDLSGLSYTNTRIRGVPWSIHVVRFERTNTLYRIQTAHAEGKAIGVDTLSGQVAGSNGKQGTVVAAINGDFYERNGPYAGAPHGVQVTEGELLSGPSGSSSFWTDSQGQPHLGKVESHFQVVWPDGTSTAFGLNEDRRGDKLELYTPALGTSTHTYRGREITLEPDGTGQWLPLQLGQVYAARVRGISNTGNTRIEPGTMVLSAEPALFNRLPSIAVGAKLQLRTTSIPALLGIRAAISGGPVLVANGQRRRTLSSHSFGYESGSMAARHPRSAVGWNQSYFYLVVVDGRQPNLSIGMTMDELSDFMVRLGCEEAMNLDGGGSTTLWYDGQVRNSPCERAERDISNCLIIVKGTLRNSQRAEQSRERD